MIGKALQEWADAKRTVDDVFTKDPAKSKAVKDLERRQRKRDDKKVTLISFGYDKKQDCYIWKEDTKAKMGDVPAEAVHVTGKKRRYFHTDLWNELTWPLTGQSAIHMYLWMINTKINPEAITEKRRGNDMDMKKILMYGAIGIVIVIVAWQFIPKG